MRCKPRRSFFIVQQNSGFLAPLAFCLLPLASFLFPVPCSLFPVLRLKQPQRVLYLAVPLSIYDDFFGEELPQLSIKEFQVNLLVFDPNQEVIVEWIN
ncbi:element excision factor XisH family protein [Moorena producens JHB]|uniref:Element excision factor XisH family protein n=1 Tax=Moorena producens (strain JHB) TaxID=1454205 RepID=A0A1D9GCA9_MOOP1|nr:element excision factor XisH family protein [Moorena producens]AOY85000.2 element excision factor XisH family protein [Moorena producens JHB]